MAAIHLRQDKERPLTIQEVDENFDSINREVGQKLDTLAFNATNILQLLNGNAGAGSTLDADKVQGKYPTSAANPNTVVIRDGSGNTYFNQVYGLHIGDVVGDVQGTVTGALIGNATNVDGVVQVEHGGTGGTTPSAARQNIGCGSMAVQNKNTVDITGGTITGITDLTVADGGTGASTASGARSNLGLVIGADVQSYAAILSGISSTAGDGLIIRTTTNSAVSRKFIQGNSIEITNPTGKDGDITVALALAPSVSSITKAGTDGTGDIGQSNNRFATIYGTATSAKYADLAEKYTTDKHYEPGTVIVVAHGGDSEATASFQLGQRVIGVVSTKPAHIMNDESTGQAIGLTGRLPVKVTGPIKKGQTLIASPDGYAVAGEGQNVIGQALETNLNAGVKLVECIIK
jgi:hypothetical protein